MCWPALAAGLFISAAQAQPACAPHDDVAGHLLAKYGERRAFIGVTRDGNLFELYASPTGTWSVVVTVPGGLSCLTDNGVHGSVIEAMKGRRA